MGVYARQDSPYWWITVGRPGQRPLIENTKIPKKGATAQQTKQLRRDAEEAYATRAADLARARYELPPTREAAAPDAITFEKWAKWYETHVSAKKPGAEREQQMIDRFRAAFRDQESRSLPLAGVTKSLVEEYRTERLNKVKASTVNREMNLLRHMFAQAVPEHLETSPLPPRALKKLREAKFEARALTPAEETRLLAELRPADRVMLIMGLDTLMRLGDIFDAKWSHDKGDHFEVPDPKTDQPYKVPISARLREHLDRLPRTSPYLFPHRRHAKKENDRAKAVRLMLQRACERANVLYGRKKGGITWHSATRHTGTTRMVNDGVSLRTIQEVGNWRTLSQLQRYGHPSEEAKRRAVEAPAAAAIARAGETPRGPTTAVLVHRVRHRKDLDRLATDGVEAWRLFIERIGKLKPSELRKATVVLRMDYGVAKPAEK